MASEILWPLCHHVATVFRHKYHVARAGRSLGVSWRRCLIHDVSKLMPSEALPYARHFYGRGSSQEEFDRAWSEHWHRNDHHWQYWRGREMSEDAVREMVADWLGASAVYGGWFWDWYEKNKSRIELGPEAREILTRVLKEVGE